MVTLVVLSTGIVFVYKSFFLCVDYLSRISARLHANELIDERIADITRLVRGSGAITVDAGPSSVTWNINNKPVDFQYQVQWDPVPGYDGLYRLDVGVSWRDAGRPARLAHSAVISL